MTQYASDVLRIMRLAIGRRNENDPDSSDSTLFTYINYFIENTMSDDVKLFENFGTLSFTIDQTHTDGVYTIDEVYAQAGQRFINLSQEAFISLLAPVNNSVSWNQLPIYQDPGEFFAIWGINNDEILIPGYPTMMLYYGDEFTFRTIPQTEYLIKMYGYKQSKFLPGEDDDSPDLDQILPYSSWLRYVAYGAAMNYATDYNYAQEDKNLIKEGFTRERKLRLTNTHNQIKMSRCLPRF